MASGLALGLWIAQILVDRERRKFKSRYIYFYDKNGKSIPILKKDKNETKTN